MEFNVDFLKKFLVQLDAFNKTCEEFATAEEKELRYKISIQENSFNALLQRQRGQVRASVSSKSSAFKQYESKLLELAHNDTNNQDEAEIMRKRDLLWNEYQDSCKKILEDRDSQFENDKEPLRLEWAKQSAERKDLEANLQHATLEKVNTVTAQFTKMFNPREIKEKYAEMYSAEPFVENFKCKMENPSNVRIAALTYDLSALNLGKQAKSLLEVNYPSLYRHGKLNIPYGITFEDGFNCLFEFDAANREMFANRASALAMRLFMTIPPNKVNFTFIDPIRLGESFALFTRLVDVDDRTSKVINGKIWTSTADIDDRLRVLTDHIANVTQRCLQGKYENLQKYNNDAGQNAEPYQILMIMDFPGNFREDSLRMLEQIISTGPKCGVYTVILKNEEQVAKIDDKLKPHINNIEARTEKFIVEGNRIVCGNDGFNGTKFPLVINPLLSRDELEVVVPILKEGIKNAEKIVINFCERKEMLPAGSEWFKGNSREKLVIPLGIHGVNEVQNLVFGDNAYHALIIGQTGSGKSSLLHTIIMSSLIRYPADELSIFLVDFKRGVEFKIYANHQLEAFRAVAIESEREFGESVLSFLDKEQSRRAELFRRENVDNIQAYRAKKDKNGKNFLLPRILLIIDEFHVLFSRDGDATGRSASSHLEQIIKQGRAFGIHVVLASQTMANVGGIHQSLWGQVGIRIALKCPPADAKLILAEDNDGVDLLASNEPGLAVYNSDCGNKIANTVFRIAYIEQNVQEGLLKDISGVAPKPEINFPETRVMVSNIEDNLYHPYQKFIGGGKPDEFKEKTILIGEPLQLSGRLRSVFKTKEFSNLLVIGKDTQKARAMFTFSSLSLAIHGLTRNDWKNPSSPSVHIMDFAPPEEEDDRDALQALKKMIPNHVKYEEFDDSIEFLKELHRNLPTRGKDSESQYLLLFGLQRARSLRQSSDPYQGQKRAVSGIDDDTGLEINLKPSVSPYQMFLNIINEGPQKNIHTILWIDNFKTFQAHYSGLLQSFDLRVGFTMPNDDSVLFMEEPDGSQISENNAVFSYNGNQKFRSYQTPDSSWLKEICARINSF